MGRDFFCPPLREEWSTSGKTRISLDLAGDGRDFAIQLRKRGSSGALFYAYGKAQADEGDADEATLFGMGGDGF